MACVSGWSADHISVGIWKDKRAFQISNLQNIATDAGGWRVWQFCVAGSKGRNREGETHFPCSPRFNVQNSSWLIVAHMPLSALCYKPKYFILKLKLVEPKSFTVCRMWYPTSSQKLFSKKRENTYYFPMSPVGKQMCSTEEMRVSHCCVWPMNTQLS